MFSWGIPQRKRRSLIDDNGVFYEQVTGVKGLGFCFLHQGLFFCCCWFLSRRKLLSTGFLYAL